MIADFALPIAAMLAGAALVLAVEFFQYRREMIAARQR